MVLASGMTYEAGNAQGPVFAAYLWLASRHRDARRHPLRRQWALLLLAPLIVYLAWDFIDFRYVHPTIPEIGDRGMGNLQSSFGAMKTMGNMLAIPLAYLYAALFPAAQRATCGASLTCRPVIWDFAQSFSIASSPFVFVAAVLAAGCLLAAAYDVARRFVARRRESSGTMGVPRWGFVAVLLVLLCAQLLIVVVGRANTRGLVAYLFADSSYYAYLVTPLVLLAVYAVCRVVYADGGARHAGRYYRFAIAAMLVAVSLINACKAYAMNARVRDQYPPCPGIAFAHVDRLNLNARYGCGADVDYRGIVALAAYTHLKRGIARAMQLGRPEIEATNIALAARLTPLNDGFVRAIEYTEQNDFTNAAALLGDPNVTRDIHPWLITCEYGRACYRALERCHAAIARTPDNPALYHERAIVYMKLGYYERALADIARVRALGGAVDSTLLDDLRASSGMAVPEASTSPKAVH